MSGPKFKARRLRQPGWLFVLATLIGSFAVLIVGVGCGGPESTKREVIIADWPSCSRGSYVVGGFGVDQVLLDGGRSRRCSSHGPYVRPVGGRTWR